MVFRRFVEFFGNSIDRIGHEHFLATVDFKLSNLVGPMTKFWVLALSVQTLAKCLTLDPSTSFFPQVLIKTAESKSGFRLQLLYYTRSVAKHCDWNQAPGCQRETPQIEETNPRIEEKSSFRFNCLTLSRQAKMGIGFVVKTSHSDQKLK